MDENGIVTTFSDVSSADEAVARPKELAGEDQIDSSDGAIGERGHDGTLHLRDEAGDEADRALEHISRSIRNGRTAVPADLDASAPAAVDAAMAVPDGPVTRYARTEVGAAEIAGAEDAAHEGSVKARDELHHERRRATVEKAKLRELRGRRRHPVHH